MKQATLAVALFVMPCIAYGQNNALPTLQDGDIVSADVLNDAFRRIDNVTVGFSDASEIVGTWRVTAYGISSSLPGFLPDPSGLFYIRQDTITFTDNGDGTFSFATSSHPISRDFVDRPDTGPYLIRHNRCILRDNTASERIREIQKLSPTRFAWTDTPGESFVVFDKPDPPPAIPQDLQGSVSNATATLTWTDASNNETGFRVYRRDALDGNYAEVATVGAGIVTYSDAGLATGDHWYRVAAYNATGESIGSNVVKMTVP